MAARNQWKIEDDFKRIKYTVTDDDGTTTTKEKAECNHCGKTFRANSTDLKGHLVNKCNGESLTEEHKTFLKKILNANAHKRSTP